jgi:integrase
VGTIRTGYTLEYDDDGSVKLAKTDGTTEDHKNLVESMKLRHELGQQSHRSQATTARSQTIGSNNSKNLDKTFQQIADEYISNNRHKWVVGTVEQRAGELDKLSALLPKVRLQGFTEAVTKQLIDDLSVLPLRCNLQLLRNNNWRDSGKRSISGSTQEKYFVIFKEVIESALIGSDVESIVGKLEVKANGASTSYQPFSDDDLNTIFNGCVYNGECHQYKARKDYMYWLPLIGLFTGMRLNEICQLHVRDVKEFQGTYYFDNNLNFHDSQIPDKTLKGRGDKRASIRLVPVHDELIKLGFLDFVRKSRSGKNAHMLFEKLTMSARGKWYKEPSRYFGKYLTELGIVSEDKVYHSFRHNFVTAMVTGCYHHTTPINDLGEKRKRIVGHSLPDEVTQIYIHLGEEAVPPLKEVIDLVKYDIDLSHLHIKRK